MTALAISAALLAALGALAAAAWWVRVRADNRVVEDAAANYRRSNDSVATLLDLIQEDRT